MIDFARRGYIPRKYNRYKFFLTFDIETSRISRPDGYETFMYIWQCSIGDDVNVDTYYGRTWQDFKNLLHLVKKLTNYKQLIIYVHNLGYEFQFLRSIFEWQTVFAIKPRVPLYATTTEGYTFRCSYKLTNMSLSAFLIAENVKNLKGTLDYSKVRYADSELTDSELEYCQNDVLGLHQAITSLHNNDSVKYPTIYSLPLTSTGFVRNDCRNAVRFNPANIALCRDLALNVHLYAICKFAVRGGNTHANIRYSNQILQDVYSYDIQSSYPWVMCTCRFACTPYERMQEDTEITEEYAHLIVIEYTDVCIRPDVTIPYISFSNCMRISGALKDNGRVLSCDYCVMAITEIDYNIIASQYDYQYRIVEHYRADKDLLPIELRQTIMDYYYAKCTLKGVNTYFYSKSKNKLNAIYGMMLTAIDHDQITYQDGDWQTVPCDILGELNKHYHGKKLFNAYQWGLTVLSEARKHLQEGIDAVGADMVYCDTDSIKCLNGHQDTFRYLNDIVKSHNDNITDVKPYVEYNGKRYDLGIWEDENNGDLPEYTKFKTMGAKKYAYILSDGDKIGVTVSGLSKIKGAEYLKTHGGLEAFKAGTIFHVGDSGRTTTYYDDNIRWEEREYNGHIYESTSNVSIEDTTYTLSLADDYARLLKEYEG